MYRTPAFDVASRTEVREALRRIAFGHLVTRGAAGSRPFESTALPYLVDDDLTELRGHLARANRHWRHIDGSDALVIVPGPDAYVSPRWYASKAEHGRVVPTWNYEVVHLQGTVEVVDDRSWLRSVVTELTDQHEPEVEDPERSETWAVSDAPADYLDAKLRAIVGVRLHVRSVDAKRKLSQDKQPADRTGVLEGLGRSAGPGAETVADLMRFDREA